MIYIRWTSPKVFDIMPKDHENLHYDLYEAVEMKVTWPTLNIVRYLCILRLITGARDERSEQNIRERNFHDAAPPLNCNKLARDAQKSW